MRVSIALATYNGGKYLQAQLDSFAAQERLPDELVICDDGSNDSTIDIVEKFARTAPFSVKVMRNQINLGYAKNFEKAMLLCSGDIIFISDHDDVWFADKLKVVEQAFSADSSVKVTINDLILTDSDLNHNNVTLLGNLRAAGAKENRLIAGCAVAIKREMLEVFCPFPHEYIGHDGWIADLSMSLGVRRLIDRPLQFFRRHGENASQWIYCDPQGPTPISIRAQAGFTSPLDSWSSTLERLQVQIARILERQTKLGEIGISSGFDHARKYLDIEVWRFKTRMHLLSLPRYRRWLSVIAFWVQGGYRRFAGWKSAVKDMIRP